MSCTLTGRYFFQGLLRRTKCLQSDLEGVLKASKDLVSVLDPSATALIQSESRLLSRGVLRLSQQLSQRLGQLQVFMNEGFMFSHSLSVSEFCSSEAQRHGQTWKSSPLPSCCSPLPFTADNLKLLCGQHVTLTYKLRLVSPRRPPPLFCRRSFRGCRSLKRSWSPWRRVCRFGISVWTTGPTWTR